MVYGLGNIRALILASQEQLRLRLKDCTEPQHYHACLVKLKTSQQDDHCVYQYTLLRYQNATSVLYQELQKGLEVC